MCLKFCCGFPILNKLTCHLELVACGYPVTKMKHYVASVPTVFTSMNFVSDSYNEVKQHDFGNLVFSGLVCPHNQCNFVCRNNSASSEELSSRATMVGYE